MKRGSGGVAPGFRRGRGVGPERHDAYKPDAKLRGPAYCGGCGATYERGRWTWKPRGARAVPTTCPACRRVRERQPAGVLRLDGAIAARGGKLVHLVRNVEQAERTQHPMERLMSIRTERGVVVIETTGPHLARRLADAIERAYHCKLALDFLREQDLVRVTTPK